MTNTAYATKIPDFPHEVIESVATFADHIRSHAATPENGTSEAKQTTMVFWDWDRVITDHFSENNVLYETLIEDQATKEVLYTIKELEIPQMVVTARWHHEQQVSDPMDFFIELGTSMHRHFEDEEEHPFLDLHAEKPSAYYLTFQDKKGQQYQELSSYIYKGIMFCPQSNKVRGVHAFFMSHPQHRPSTLFYIDDQKLQLYRIHTYMKAVHPEVQLRLFHLPYPEQKTD